MQYTFLAFAPKVRRESSARHWLHRQHTCGKCRRHWRSSATQNRLFAQLLYRLHRGMLPLPCRTHRSCRQPMTPRSLRHLLPRLLAVEILADGTPYEPKTERHAARQNCQPHCHLPQAVCRSLRFEVPHLHATPPPHCGLSPTQSFHCWMWQILLPLPTQWRPRRRLLPPNASEYGA